MTSLSMILTKVASLPASKALRARRDGPGRGQVSFMSPTMTKWRGHASVWERTLLFLGFGMEVLNYLLNPLRT